MTAGTCHQTQKPSLMWLAVTFQAFQLPPPPPSGHRHWFNDTARHETFCKNATLNRPNKLQAYSLPMHWHEVLIQRAKRSTMNWRHGTDCHDQSSDTMWLDTQVQYRRFGGACCLHLQNVQHHVWYFRNMYIMHIKVLCPWHFTDISCRSKYLKTYTTNIRKQASKVSRKNWCSNNCHFTFESCPQTPFQCPWPCCWPRSRKLSEAIPIQKQTATRKISPPFMESEVHYWSIHYPVPTEPCPQTAVPQVPC